MSVTNNLILRRLQTADEQAMRAAQAVLAASDRFEFAPALPDNITWHEYLSLIADREHGRNLPGHVVPDTFLVATVGAEIVGRAAIRHHLNDRLRARGGHIGFAVLPQHRRKGYGRMILASSLHAAREHGLERVLLSCDDTNKASVSIIESCGGIIEAIETVDEVLIRRYWIEVA